MGSPLTLASTPARLIAVAALVWATLLPLAAAGAAGASAPASPSLTLAVYGIGRVICHQRPERSFHWASQPWPVCARCTGLYAGAAAAALASLFLLRTRAGRYSPARARIWIAAASVPAAMSVVYEWIVSSTPSNAVRATTGMILGAAVLWTLVAFVTDWSRTDDEVN